MNVIKCGVCQKEADDLRGLCQDLGHLICVSCFVEYKTSMGQSGTLKCPLLGEDEMICGSDLIEDGGVQDQMVLDAMETESVPCVATALFGCTFTGTLGEMVQHAKYDCAFKHLFVCNPSVFSADGKNCGSLFETPMMRIQHLKEKHSFSFSSHSELLVKLAFENSASHLDKNWIMLRRLVIDYNGNQFCMLNVDENRTDVRFWLSEMEPCGDDKSAAAEQSYSITVPFKPLVKAGPVFKCTAVIQPYKMEGFQADDDDLGYFEVEKKYLRRAGDVTKNGKVVFRILIKFPYDSFPSGNS